MCNYTGAIALSMLPCVSLGLLQPGGTSPEQTVTDIEQTGATMS